jgi:hypothetical protein
MLAWFVVFRLLRTNLKWAPFIRCAPDATGNAEYPQYRLRLDNRRGWRSAFDVEIFVRYSATHVSEMRPSIRTYMNIPSTNQRVPVIGPNGNNIIVVLLLDDLPDRYEQRVRDTHLWGKLRESRAGLRELFDSVGQDSYIEVFAWAYDSFSGARRMHRRRYSAGQVDYEGRKWPRPVRHRFPLGRRRPTETLR